MYKRQGIINASVFKGLPGTDVLRGMFNGKIPSDWSAVKAKEVMLRVKPGAVEYYDRDGKLAIASPKSHRLVGTEWVRATPADFAVGDMRPPHVEEGSVRKISPDAINKRNSVTATFADINRAFAESSRTYPEKGSQFARDLLALDGGKELTETITLDGVVDVYSALTIARSDMFLDRRSVYHWRSNYAYMSFHQGDVIRLYDPSTFIDGEYVFITHRRRIGLEGVFEWEGFEFFPTDFDWQAMADDDVSDFITELPETALPRNVRATYNEDTGWAQVEWLPPIGVQIERYEARHRVDDQTEEEAETFRTIPADEPLFARLQIEFGDHIHRFAVRAIGVRRVASDWVEAGPLDIIRTTPERALPLDGGCPPEIHTADNITDDQGNPWAFLGDPYSAISRARGNAASCLLYTSPSPRD